MVGCDYMEVIVFSVSVNHVNGSLLDFTFLIPYGLYLLLCFLLKEFINSLYYKSIKSEVSISKKRFTTIKHFVYDTLIDLPNSKFVLMIDEETKIITPAVYTKRNGRVSMINSLYYKSIKSEVSISKKRFTTIKHFVYDTLIDLPNSKFVLMIDEETKIITPAVYTKRNGRVSMINRNADFDVYEQIEINNGSFLKDYTFIRSYKIRDKKTGEQVLFVAVPNRETDILAYSDSAHKADKTVTFGKFRIFCFIETDNNPYTDLLVDSEKIHLEKSKRKGMYFIGLDEVTKEK